MGGFGGVGVEDYSKESRERLPTTLASSLLLAVDRVFGCDWEMLPSQYCRAYGTFSEVYAIGHVLLDKWLWFDVGDMNFVVGSFAQMGCLPHSESKDGSAQ